MQINRLLSTHIWRGRDSFIDFLGLLKCPVAVLCYQRPPNTKPLLCQRLLYKQNTRGVTEKGTTKTKNWEKRVRLLSLLWHLKMIENKGCVCHLFGTPDMFENSGYNCSLPTNVVSIGFELPRFAITTHIAHWQHCGWDTVRKQNKVATFLHVLITCPFIGN